MWEIERVYTHRSEDRTNHHVAAYSKAEAEHILETLERNGETDSLGDKIESMAGKPLHVHVSPSIDYGIEDAENTPSRQESAGGSDE